jgi:hypothetical protein
MTMATSHKDLQGDILTEQALKSGIDVFHKFYLPINIRHDITKPPVGRIVSAEVVKLPDGESALI